MRMGLGSEWVDSWDLVYSMCERPISFARNGMATIWQYVFAVLNMSNSIMSNSGDEIVQEQGHTTTSQQLWQQCGNDGGSGGGGFTKLFRIPVPRTTNRQ